jgi:hypothetical protein
MASSYCGHLNFDENPFLRDGLRIWAASCETFLRICALLASQGQQHCRRREPGGSQIVLEGRASREVSFADSPHYSLRLTIDMAGRA